MVEENMIMQIEYDDLEIIRRVFQNELYEINICRCYSKEERLYTVICLKDIDLFHEEIKLFSDLRHRQKFKDFITCFSRNSYVYIVFSYYTESRINFAEISEKGIIEKADIVKGILSYIVVSDIPDHLLYDILSEDNINLNDSKEIYFNYFLKSIDNYDTYKSKKYMRRLKSILLSLFGDQFYNISQLKRIIDKLSKEQYENVMEIYMDFICLYDEFNKCTNDLHNNKASLEDKIKNKLGEIIKKTGYVFVTVLLVIAVVSFIVKYTDSKKENNNVRIQSIGTRIIK